MKLRDYDFTAFTGLTVPVSLRGVPGLRCSKCKEVTLEGDVINAALRVLALAVLKIPGRLPGDLAKYLRRALGMTQQELATRMKANRVTVTRWETGEDEISPQNDFILRSLVIAETFSSWKAGISSRLRDEAAASLNAVRSSPPGAVPSPFVIDDFLGKKREDRLAS